MFCLNSVSNMSLTLLLTNKNSIIAVNYFQVVNLNDGGYKLGLIDFENYYTYLLTTILYLLYIM